MAHKKRSGAGTPKTAKRAATEPPAGPGGTPAVQVAGATPWDGEVRIVVRKPGRAGRVTVLNNLIVDSGKALLALALRDGAALPEITYVAVGSDNTAPAAGDTALGTETFRKAVTAQAEGSASNKTITTVYLAPYEANGQIEEIGWYGGEATDDADSGVLIARVLYSKLKDALESIQIERTDTVG